MISPADLGALTLSFIDALDIDGVTPDKVFSVTITPRNVEVRWYPRPYPPGAENIPYAMRNLPISWAQEPAEDEPT